MKGKIEFSNGAKQEMISEIKAYFLKERDEELGDLAARLIMEFFIEKLSKHAYNQGVYDSYRYISTACEDMLGLEKR